MAPPPSPAEIQRRKVWDMPKDTLSLQKEQQVRYVDVDGRNRTRNLVVLKGTRSNRIVERSAKIIANGVPKSRRLRWMYYEQVGKNWARDIPEERSRSGWRAFRINSGMRDQRYDPVHKHAEPRLPDHRRKRFRWGDRRKRKFRWRGLGKSPTKGFKK